MKEFLGFNRIQQFENVRVNSLYFVILLCPLSMFFTFEWENKDKDYVNVHIDPLAQFLALRPTANNEKSFIASLSLNELNSFFEIRECIGFNLKLFF